MILDPPSVTIPEGEEATITLSFNVTGVAPKESRILVTSDHEHVSTIMEQEFFVQDLSRSVNLTVYGKLIGRCKLLFRYFESPGAQASSDAVLSVAVIRSIEFAQLLFTIFVTILVSINNISMGCVISLDTIVAVVKKPVAPIIGFACQFLIMPLGSYCIGRYFFPDDVNFRLGLFVLGCCPGGTGSNFWTLLFDGDVDLSITMTFFSTIAAMGETCIYVSLCSD
jgi:hypothetical protein